MMRLIIEKELREIIGSTKFAVAFGVCSLLILLAFYVGATEYHTSVARFEGFQKENLKQMEGGDRLVECARPPDIPSAPSTGVVGRGSVQ